MENEWNSLGKKQEEFAVAIADLILFAHSKTIKVRIKDAFRDPRLHGKYGEKLGYGAANSVHKLSLAVDLYTENPKNHKELHDYWDSLGGAPRIENDMNHYSFKFQNNW